MAFKAAKAKNITPRWIETFEGLQLLFYQILSELNHVWSKNLSLKKSDWFSKLNFKVLMIVFMALSLLSTKKHENTYNKMLQLWGFFSNLNPDARFWFNKMLILKDTY